MLIWSLKELEKECSNKKKNVSLSSLTDVQKRLFEKLFLAFVNSYMPPSHGSMKTLDAAAHNCYETEEDSPFAAYWHDVVLIWFWLSYKEAAEDNAQKHSLDEIDSLAFKSSDVSCYSFWKGMLETVDLHVAPILSRWKSNRRRFAKCNAKFFSKLGLDPRSDGPVVEKISKMRYALCGSK